MGVSRAFLLSNCQRQDTALIISIVFTKIEPSIIFRYMHLLRLYRKMQNLWSTLNIHDIIQTLFYNWRISK